MKIPFFIQLILTIVAGIIIAIGIDRVTDRIEAEKASALSGSVLSVSEDVTTINRQNSAGLKQSVDQALAGTTGSYAVVIKNLKTGEGYSLNDHKVYQPGSLYKLWVMAAVFNQLQNHAIEPDDELTDSVQNLNRKFDIDPDSAELTSGTIDFSVNSALTQMITISHNYAALILSDKIQLSNVTKFLQTNGFKESAIGDPPETTASDIALFYEKLYKGELGNPDMTQQMIALLKSQKLNDKLPKELPSGTVIAHKTGELYNFSHDAGIVYSPAGDYIIVVLSESTSPAGAEERIAAVSKAVYDYFN